MDQALFAYAIPGIAKDFNLSLDRIGSILTISFGVAGVSVLLSGVMTDYIGRRLMLILLLITSGLLVGSLALAQTVFLLTTLRALGFASGASLYPIINTYVVEASPSRYRGLMTGVLAISYPIGWFIASLAAGPLVAHYGWRSVFYPAFLVVPVAPILGLFLKETNRFQSGKVKSCRKNGIVSASEIPLIEGKRSITKHFGEIFSPPLRRRALACFVGTFLVAVTTGGTSYFLPTFFIQARGMNESSAIYITGMSFGIGAIGYILTSFIGEFILTRRNTLILWVWLGFVVFACTLWLARSYWSLVVGVGLSLMFFCGCESVRAPLIGELFPTRVRATATAFASSVPTCIGWLIAPILVASFVPHVGWAWALTCFTAVPLALAGFAYCMLEDIPPGMEID
jgi:MFS family permease